MLNPAFIAGFFYAIFFISLFQIKKTAMKKILLFLMTVCLITSAQEIESDAENTYKNIKQINEQNKSATVIWSEDFGNGFPAAWTTSTANTAGGVATCNWAWSTDGSWGNFSGGGLSLIHI